MDQNVIIISEDKGQKPKILPEQCFPAGLSGSYINTTNGPKCNQTLQLTKECDERLSAKFVVKTEGGRRITVWAYDDLRKILKCGIQDQKKLL